MQHMDPLHSTCLKGLAGDSVNAVLAAAGSNLMKLLREIAHALIFWLTDRLASRSTPAATCVLPSPEDREPPPRIHARAKQAFSGTTQ
jgi:hypothetical protein